MARKISITVVSVGLSLMMGLASAASVSAGQGMSVPSGARLAEVKGLYESAEYDRALAAVNRDGPVVLVAGEARDLEVYETLCLLALGRKAEANAKIEAVVRAEPLYRPSSDMPNRLRTLVEEVRGRLAPALAQSHYLAGKTLFEAGQYPAAVEELALVLALTDGAAESSRELADIRVLATGFRDLAVRAMAAARVAPAQTQAAEQPAEGQLIPPVAVRQDLPAWPAPTSGSRREAQRVSPLSGVLEVVITKTGTVGSAKLVKRIEPMYDALLLNAAAQWKYQPATQNGVPVEYVKRLAVNIR